MITTLASGTTAPVWSVTTPFKAPEVVVWAVILGKNEIGAESRQRSKCERFGQSCIESPQRFDHVQAAQTELISYCLSDFPSQFSKIVKSSTVLSNRGSINRVNSRRGVTFVDLAQHYAEHELVDQAESIHAKAHTTVRSYERIIRNRLLPRWGNRIGLGIEPLEVEQWLKDFKRERKFANPTLDKTRRVMSSIYKHGQRYGLIPRNQESNPMHGILSSHRDVRGHWSMTTHDGSVFTICATVSRRFSSVSEPIQKTVQTLLRHSDVKLTLQFYTHAVSRDRMAGQERCFRLFSATRRTKAD